MRQQAGSITYLKLIGTMFMWGGTWIAGRVVAQELTAPLAAPALRFLLAGLILAGFALATEGRIPRPQTGSEWLIVTGLALTGVFIYALCFFYGLKHITAGQGALVVALAPPKLRYSSIWSRFSPFCKLPSCSMNGSVCPSWAAACWSLPAFG